ncbi:MAG: 4Fe-4S double cluster binding domain-containing protein [Nitrososphaerota archaeon]|nr:4Fe-4S double cluster binding domain-containing protein [Nitrososphaerota archaeon]
MVKNENLLEKLTMEVKQLAFQAGASLVGVVSADVYDSLPKVWISWKVQDYSKKAVELMAESKSIIVLGYHVWDDMLELAVRKGEGWVYPGYSPLEVITRTVENFLEKLGFKAVSAQGLSYKRLAQLAGFGCYGKNTLIINPVFGPWIRLAAVLTDAKLVVDEPFTRDLCVDCEECVKACPVGALSPYKIDVNKCLVGVRLLGKGETKNDEMFRLYEPAFTENAHLMCLECQKACRYGRSIHSSLKLRL